MWNYLVDKSVLQIFLCWDVTSPPFVSDTQKFAPLSCTHSVKVCDQSSVYCGVFVVTVDNFSFGCRFVFASNRFRRFPDWLLSTKLTNDVGSHRETTFWWIWNHLVDNSVDSVSISSYWWKKLQSSRRHTFAKYEFRVPASNCAHVKCSLVSTSG